MEVLVQFFGWYHIKPPNLKRIMNLLLNGFICPNCDNKYDTNTHNALTDAFYKDYRKSELVCVNCGLVVQDTTLSTLADLEYIAENSVREKPISRSGDDVLDALVGIQLDIELKKARARERRKRKKKK